MVYKVASQIHDSPRYFMVEPLTGLAILSIFSGYLFQDMFIGFGSTFFNNAIFTLPNAVKGF